MKPFVSHARLLSKRYDFIIGYALKEGRQAVDVVFLSPGSCDNSDLHFQNRAIKLNPARAFLLINMDPFNNQQLEEMLMEGFNKILYPIALTDISPSVAPYVVTMAKQFDAEIHLLHVLRRFDWFVDTYISDPPKPDFKRIASDFESQVLVQAKQKLDAFIARYFKDVRIGNAAVVSGTNYKLIVEYVESESIDLIIMGVSSTMQKMVFGSVADKVTRLAPVPVMLIKSRASK